MVEAGSLRNALAASPVKEGQSTQRSLFTCYVRYTIDDRKIAEFDEYARMWLALVARFGGTHHGYFLPSEGESDVALAIFSLASLGAYE